jgi:hypothetical protein
MLRHWLPFCRQELAPPCSVPCIFLHVLALQRAAKFWRSSLSRLWGFWYQNGLAISVRPFDQNGTQIFCHYIRVQLREIKCIELVS